MKPHNRKVAPPVPSSRPVALLQPITPAGAPPKNIKLRARGAYPADAQVAVRSANNYDFRTSAAYFLWSVVLAMGWWREHRAALGAVYGVAWTSGRQGESFCCTWENHGKSWNFIIFWHPQPQRTGHRGCHWFLISINFSNFLFLISLTKKHQKTPLWEIR